MKRLIYIPDTEYEVLAKLKSINASRYIVTLIKKDILKQYWRSIDESKKPPFPGG
jgi:hypothetical protein